MAALSTVEMQQHLRVCGWDNVPTDGVLGFETTRAITNFQRGFAFWPLLVDGQASEKTSDALRHSVARDGAASDHFKFKEFICKGGIEQGCQRIWILRDLIWALEVYRTLAGSVYPVSGCRCTRHNARVGGASSSQHLYGSATDIPQKFPATTIRRLDRFSGLGYQGNTGLVRHVDVRHLSGHNTTGGTPVDPTVWKYA